MQWLPNLLSCCVSDLCNTWPTDSDLRMHYINWLITLVVAVSDCCNTWPTDSDLRMHYINWLITLVVAVSDCCNTGLTHIGCGRT